ncbi:hypothetical protein C5688_13555 [Methylocystis sp. MitZ-2018]|nr:hypothetical protein C5688_13555 [Methylocystis sp. MitZ-2018]
MEANAMSKPASRTVPLSRELQTHKGPIKEIVLNEPTLRTFRQYGEPWKLTSNKDGHSTEFDNAALTGFLVDMSGHDVVVLETMPARDWISVRQAMVELLMGVAGDRPTAA